MRTRSTISGLLIMCGLLFTLPVHAFEQTPHHPTAPPVSKPEKAESKTPAVIPGAKTDGNLQLQQEDGKKGFRIPGIGSIGLFPKLDFGLELLYTDPSRGSGPETGVTPESDGDDVQIRGRLKKRF